jgi:hypothetical protein
MLHSTLQTIWQAQISNLTLTIFNVSAKIPTMDPWNCKQARYQVSYVTSFTSSVDRAIKKNGIYQKALNNLCVILTLWKTL